MRSFFIKISTSLIIFAVGMLITSPVFAESNTFAPVKVEITHLDLQGFFAGQLHFPSFTIPHPPPVTEGDVTLTSSALGEFHYNNCPTVTAVLNNSSINQRKVLIDFELRNSDGTLVNQYFVDNYTVPSALTRSPSFVMNQCDIKLPNGNYIYSIGLFNPSWNGLIHWYSNVQTFTVSFTPPPM